MRNKKDILKKWHKNSSSFTDGDILDNQQILLELILDIRDLLNKEEKL